MTPAEEAQLQANFKSALVMIRHAVGAVESMKQAEYFFRELDQECHRLAPKFRKGNQLSSMLAKNSLRLADKDVLHSATG